PSFGRNIENETNNQNPVINGNIGNTGNIKGLNQQQIRIPNIKNPLNKEEFEEGEGEANNNPNNAENPSDFGFMEEGNNPFKNNLGFSDNEEDNSKNTSQIKKKKNSNGIFAPKPKIGTEKYKNKVDPIKRLNAYEDYWKKKPFKKNLKNKSASANKIKKSSNSANKPSNLNGDEKDGKKRMIRLTGYTDPIRHYYKA
ncbi:MAG: hypothetical protein MJ252_25595, partial [archaeon]|nr:hypothetical protein [archaeon]